MTRDELLEAWDAFVETEYKLAIEATRESLLDRDAVDLFKQFYDVRDVKRVLFGGGPHALAYRFASEELLRWWEEHPRVIWSEFALRAGMADSQTTRIARRTDGHRAEAARRAWQRIADKSRR